MLIGLNEGLSGVATKCLLSTVSLTGSLCQLSSTLRDAVLTRSDFISQLLGQLHDLKYIKELDEVNV